MAVLRCARIGYLLDKHIPQATRIPQKHALGLGPGVGTGFVKKTGFVERTRALKNRALFKQIRNLRRYKRATSDVGGEYALYMMSV